IFFNENQPRILEHAVRLAEPWLARSERVRADVFRLAGSDDARLRFQVALSLGEWDDDRILGPLAEIALRGADDRWTRLAVVSLGAFLKSLPKEARKVADDTEALLSRFASAAADRKRAPGERVSAIRLLAHLPWEKAEPVLMRLLERDPAQEVRLAAVRALAA